MALPAEITKEQREALDPVLQSEYVESGDKYVLDVKPVGGLQLTNVSELQKGLQLERRKAAEAEKALRKFRMEDGNLLDPEAAKTAIAKVAEMDGWDPEQKLKEHKERFETQTRDKFDREKASITKTFDEERKKLLGERDTMASQLDETLRRNTAIAAINEAKGSVKGLLPIVLNLTKIEIDEDSKRRNVVVIGDNGTPRLSPTPGQSGLMSVSELVKELKQDKELAGLFFGSGASGSGAGGSDPSGGSGRGGVSTNPFAEKTWNMTEQAKLQKSDPAEYRRLQKEAASKEPEGKAARLIQMQPARA